MDRTLVKYGFFSRPAAAGAVLFLLLAGSLVLFKTSYLENDSIVKGPSSITLRINGHPVSAGNNATVRCKSGDTLEFSVTSPKTLFFHVFFQNDGGALQEYLPQADGKALKAGSPDGALVPRSVILEKGWRKKTLYVVLAGRELPFVEAVFFINRYLRKELTRERPMVEAFYLSNKSRP